MSSFLSPSLNLRDLRQRLIWLMLFRVTVMVFIGTGFVLLQATNPRPPFSESNASIIISTLLVAYVLNLFYIYLLKKTEQTLPLFAYIQLASDVLINGALITFTGRLESPLFFLFAINVLSGAIMLYRQGAWFVVVLTVGGVILLCIYEVSLIDFNRVQSANTTLRDILTSGLLNSGIICFIATLAGHLSEQVRTAHIRLRFADADLKTVQHLNEHLLMSVHSGILHLNTQGDILFVNEAAEVIFESSALELLSCPIQNLCAHLPTPLTHIYLESGSQESSDEHRQEVLIEEEKLSSQRAHNSDSLSTLPIVLTPFHSPHLTRTLGVDYWEQLIPLKEGGERVISCSISPLGADVNAKEGWVLILQDITRLRRLELNMRRREHLASIGEMAAQIAHEVRNPLASMSSSLQLLQEMITPEPIQARLFNIMERETNRLSDLTQSFLNFARPPKAQPTSIKVRELIEEVVSLIEHQVSINVSPQLVAWVDPNHLKQIIWNLVHNASESGSSTIEVIAEERTSFEDRQEVYIEVCDRGRGLPLDVESIFKPFYTTKERGSGLGLALCRNLAEVHEGSLIASSREGGGAIFMLTLPKPVIYPLNSDQDPAQAPAQGQSSIADQDINPSLSHLSSHQKVSI